MARPISKWLLVWDQFIFDIQRTLPDQNASGGNWMELEGYDQSEQRNVILVVYNASLCSPLII